MSAEALRQPERLRPSAPERGRTLRPVAAPAPRRRPKLAYALLALAGAALIAVAQIGLTISTTQDSFVLKDLTSQNRDLTLQAQALQDELAGVSSPQALAEKAQDLGMVVAGSASYLRLSDGLVAGAGTSADWTSTIDPSGSGAVANALLSAKADAASAVAAAAAAEQESAAATAADAASAADTASEAEAATELPATIDQGLPTPSTH